MDEPPFVCGRGYLLEVIERSVRKKYGSTDRRPLAIDAHAAQGVLKSPSLALT